MSQLARLAAAVGWLIRAGRPARKPAPPPTTPGVEELEPRLVLSALGAGVRVKDAVGNTAQRARDTGVLAPGQSLHHRDAIGRPDRFDYYKVQVRTNLAVDATLAGLKANANLQLLADNQQPVAASNRGGRASDTIHEVLGPGTYYLVVAAAGRAVTRYQLTLTGQSTTARPTNPVVVARSTTGGSGTVSLIPQQGIFDLVLVGTTYSGDTNFLTAFTTFTAYENFLLAGTLVVTPPMDPFAASDNGVNASDVIINTGNIGLGGAGVLQYATNTALHTLFGGNSGQFAALDMAYVQTDPAAGTVAVQVDTRIARLSQLNTLFRGGGLLALPFQIVAGTVDLQFFDGGRQVRGSLTLYGEGYIEAGTAAVQATFEGRLR